MPMRLADYPPGWKLFAATIRVGRAGNRCECTGECGLHRPDPLPHRCIERHGHKAIYAKGRVLLTTAHLCHCSPKCMNPDHVKSMCQRCHLRLDRFVHATNRLLHHPYPLRFHPRRLRILRARRHQDAAPAPRPYLRSTRNTA